MSTVEGGSNLGDKYYNYVVRVNKDNGYYSKPKIISLTSTLYAIEQNPSLIVPSNSGKVGKVYSATPNDSTGDLTVVRNTTATYMGNDGLIKTAVANEPRFEFEPITGNFKGLLVEPQRTNLVKYSQGFTQSVWTKGGATISSSTRTAPDGSSTATELDDTGASDFPGVTTQAIIATATIVTYSIYTKNVSSTSRSFLLRNNTTSTNFIALNFNYSSTGNLGSGWFSENVGNGWFRLSYTNTTGISIGDTLWIYYGRTGAAAVGSTSKWQVWGAQLEDALLYAFIATNVTSYIPTLDSTVTRNADIISKTGIDSLIGQTEGSMYCEILHTVTNTNSGIFIVQNNADQFNNRIGFRYKPTTSVLNAFVRITGSFNSVDLDGVSPVIGQKYKMCFTYNQTEQKFFINGVLVNSRVGSYTQPNTLDQCQLGNMSNSGLPSTVNISSGILFKTVLTDTQAIQLTTI